MARLSGSDVVLGLDADTRSALLTKWLDIRDVGMLDNAWCNKTSRPEFLHCISDIKTPFSMEPLKEDSAFLAWVAKRNTKNPFFKVVATDLPPDCGYDNYFQQLGCHYSQVELSGWTREHPCLTDMLVSLAVTCTFIDDITINGMKVDFELLDFLLDAFPRLHTLHCADMAPDCFPLLIAESCPVQSLYFQDRDLNSLVKAGVVQRLVQLSIGRGRLTSTLLPMTSCRALMSLVLGSAYVDDIAACLTHTPTLQYLEITQYLSGNTQPAFFQAIAASVPLLRKLYIRLFASSAGVEQAVVDMVLQLRCLRELVLEGAREGLDKTFRAYDLSKGAPNTAMRILKLGRIFQYDCIGALMQVCPKLRVLKVEQRLRPAARQALRGMQLQRLNCAAVELQYADLRHLQNLTHLELHALYYPGEAKIAMWELKQILLRNRNLVHLDLEFQGEIAVPELLVVIAVSCPQLRFFRIYHMGASRNYADEVDHDRLPDATKSAEKKVLKACLGLPAITWA